MAIGDEFSSSHLGLYEHRLTVPGFARRKEENRETFSEELIEIRITSTAE
jgi:hypothetical protein